MLEFEKSKTLLDELESFLEEEEVKELKIELEETAFKINSPEQANYFIKKLKDIRQEKEDIIKIANEHKKRQQANIDKWLEKELSSEEYQESYIEGLLQRFYEENKDEKSKSISLPEGTLGYRKQQDKYDYYDEKALINSLLIVDKELISYKPSVEKIPLKKKAKVKDGKLFINDKLIEGVNVIPQDPKFIIK